MNRREFLKSALAFATLAPVVSFADGEGAPAADAAGVGAGKIDRRRYKDTDLSLPLLGFGMMRLPRAGGKGEIDYATAERMVARAFEAGVNYFDTAYMYHNGLSEKFVGDALSKYPRESFFLADKLPVGRIKSEEDVDRIFNEQLAKCKTPYFDFYLLHAINDGSWGKIESLHMVEYLEARRKEGKIRKLGFSFHGSPNGLRTLADKHPWDFVQIQLNCLDWTLQHAKEQYEILTSRGIPVIVMEPLRGGALASLNPAAQAILKAADEKASPSSWAFRFVASLPNVLVILSGMSRPEHLEENIGTFTNTKAFSEADRLVLERALIAYGKSGTVPCTGCRYCMPCPAGVDIPGNFLMHNRLKVSGDVERFKVEVGRLDKGAAAAACVKCGACLKKCPQQIAIPDELAKIAKEQQG